MKDFVRKGCEVCRGCNLKRWLLGLKKKGLLAKYSSEADCDGFQPKGCLEVYGERRLRKKP